MGCITEEERKKRREEKEEEEGRKGGERERTKDDKGDVSIPHFMRKMNCIISSLLTEKREIEGLKRQKNKIKMMWYICFFG
jgi:hypothetical protein